MEKTTECAQRGRRETASGRQLPRGGTDAYGRGGRGGDPEEFAVEARRHPAKFGGGAAEARQVCAIRAVHPPGYGASRGPEWTKLAAVRAVPRFARRHVSR